MASHPGNNGPVELLKLSLGERRFSRGLILLPPDPGLAAGLAPSFDRLHLLHHDYGVYRREVGAAAEVLHRFGPGWPPGEPIQAEAAVLFFPKDKDRARLLVAEAGNWVDPGGSLFVVGPNRGGVRSAPRLLEEGYGPVQRRRSGRHCLWLEARREREPLAVDDRRTFPVEAWGSTVSVVTRAGVFSHGRLDPGTEFLFSHWSPGEFDRALDWGSGSGVIGTGLGLYRAPARVDLVDADAMAVLASRETLSANGLDPDRARPGDSIPETGGPYDLIVSNPPFHAGIETAREAVRSMIRAARTRLEPGGRMVLVTNQFLNYRMELEEFVGDVRTVAENGRYRITEARLGARTSGASPDGDAQR